MYSINTRMLTEECSEKYLNKLIGRTYIEDGLKRLDKLTIEESRMATAENLKATHTVEERVKGVADTTATIDKRVTGVDNRVASVDDQVKRTANVVDEVKRLYSLDLISANYGTLHTLSENQSWESIEKWLSPPDPSTNHNIACGTYYKKTASWFFQGSIFQEWKSTGPLFWIYGKRLSHPPSNSTIFNDIFPYSWLG